MQETIDRLIEQYQERMSHVTPLVRGARIQGYKDGVQELFRALQEQALDADMKQKLGESHEIQNKAPADRSGAV